MYIRGYEPIQLSNTHHIEDLKDDSDRIYSYLKRIEDEKEFLQKRLQQLSEKAIEVLEYEYKYIIHLHRTNDYKTKHVEYNIYVYKTRVINGILAEPTRKQMDFIRIPGKDQGRKKALLKAAELKEKYKAIDIVLYRMEGKR